MSEIFDRFTKNARLVLEEAQRISKSEGVPISTELILLAIIEVPGTLSHDILKEYSVNFDQIKMLISINSKKKFKKENISENSRSVLKEAFRIASEMGHFSIDCEHILISLLSNEKYGSYQVIQKVGIEPEQIKSQLLDIFKDLREMDEMIKRQNNQPKPPLESVPEMLSDEGVKNDLAPSPILNHTKPSSIQKRAIDYFAIDLVAKAKRGEIDPTWGREKEIERCIQILLRRTKNNPVFIGEPGVGKTAIAEGIASRISKNDVPDKLIGKKIYQIDLGLMVAGTMYRGQFEERLKKVISEVKADKNIILFIDEIHSIVGTGSAEGSLDAANILKPALSKGEIRLIGATTVDEYRKYLEKDSALERRLQPIIVAEPTVDETIEILKDLRKSYEEHHQIKISDSSIVAAANLSKRFITSRFLPDKAIDLIDEASSAKTIKETSGARSKKFVELTNKLSMLTEEKEKLISLEDFESAARVRDKETKLRKEIETLKNNRISKRPVLEESDIAKLVSDITGIPSGDLSKEDTKKYLFLENELSKYIAGQNKAINDLSKALRRNRSGIGRDNKPIGSFIFLGPSGVGKTELARILAKKIYLSEKSLIKIDMSEFMEKHNVSRLVGAPPGYVGYEESGKLTEAIRLRPYSIVLFDEIEKAHPDVFNILLQIMDEGKLTDSKGKTVDFTNTIIIMTSNIGMESYRKISKFGFDIEQSGKSNQLESVIEKDLFENFRSEFINRIDKIIVFNPLSKEDLSKIAKIQLGYISDRLSKKKIKLTYSKEVINKLIAGSYDKNFGARPLIRKITEQIEDKIGDEIIKNKNLKEINVKIIKGKIEIKGS